jgi:hypothetical protein
MDSSPAGGRVRPRPGNRLFHRRLGGSSCGSALAVRGVNTKEIAMKNFDRARDAAFTVLLTACVAVGCTNAESEEPTGATSQASQSSVSGTLTVTPSTTSSPVTTSSPLTFCASGLNAGDDLLIYIPLRNSGSWHSFGTVLHIDGTGGACVSFPQVYGQTSWDYAAGDYLVTSWYYAGGLTSNLTGHATHRVAGPTATFTIQ